LKAFKGDVIESVRYIADESHITFAYGLSSGGDGDAYLCKYQLSNLKQLWCTQLVTIYEGYYSNSGLIYTVGYDMISKIDQNTGKQLWTVPSLTSSNQFESSYTKPFEDANNITFVSTIGSGATVRRFVFNNQNGKMLSKQVLPAKTFLADASQQAEGKCPK
jgi:outer membrane protein assembly factor BamB